ncbi:MAG: hypothetical protein E7652_06440 [Ruminococcaceae bacterium]|nr:hypothetical protein [Oscillospiraceae bacterium]
MDENKTSIEGTAYQNSLIYIVLVLFGILQAVLIAVAWGCYLPYSSFTVAVPSNLHRAVWTLVLIPAVITILCLWMANILNRKIGYFAMFSVFAEGIFLIFIPRIYTNGRYNVVSYFTSNFVFYIVFMVTALIIWDIWGGKRIKKRILPVIIGCLLIALSVFLTWYLIRFVVLWDILPRVVICFIIPVLCFICFLESVLSAFTAVFSKESLMVNYGVLALGVLCASFEALNHRPLRLLLCAGICVALLMQIYDLIKFITYKEKRNDS